MCKNINCNIRKDCWIIKLFDRETAEFPELEEKLRPFLDNFCNNDYERCSIYKVVEVGRLDMEIIEMNTLLPFQHQKRQKILKDEQKMNKTKSLE